MFKSTKKQALKTSKTLSIPDLTCNSIRSERKNSLPDFQELLQEAGTHHGASSSHEEESTDGGYHCKLAKPLTKQIQIHCTSCRGILCDPCLTTCCGRGFCQTCLEQLIQNSNSCPHCGMVGYDGFNNEALQKELKKIEVHCTYQNEGCLWTGTLKRLKNHLNPYNIDDSKSCGWIRVSCPLCLKLVARNIMPKHLAESCMQRRYQCPYCADFKSTFEDVMTNHKPVCKYSPTPCPKGCGESVMQVDLECHVSNDCPQRVLTCDFKAFGCTVQLPRQNMQKHLDDRSVEIKGV